MSDLTYEPAEALAPLKIGDTVDVIDRQGAVIGTQTVKRVGTCAVTTRCGRRWTVSHGEYVSHINGRRLTTWPFPSIRKSNA